MNTASMTATVRRAWSAVPPPPADDLKYLAWGWGEKASLAFIGIAPGDVDILSDGFLACTPLLDLPPAAAAAYMGTYLLSLLHGLALQERTGLFHDILTRAHLLACLTQEDFWRTVIRPFLSVECRQALVELSHYVASRRELLALSVDQSHRIVALALAS
jgi:hypothetical protein